MEARTATWDSGITWDSGEVWDDEPEVDEMTLARRDTTTSDDPDEREARRRRAVERSRTRVRYEG